MGHWLSRYMFGKVYRSCRPEKLVWPIQTGVNEAGENEARSNRQRSLPLVRCLLSEFHGATLLLYFPRTQRVTWRSPELPSLWCQIPKIDSCIIYLTHTLKSYWCLVSAGRSRLLRVGVSNNRQNAVLPFLRLSEPAIPENTSLICDAGFRIQA